MGGAVKGPPTEGRVEARLAHGAVALVIVSGELHHMAVGTGLVVAQRDGQLRPDSLPQLGGDVIGLHLGMVHQPVGNLVVVLGMIGDIGHRPLAHVEITRQSGVAGELGLVRPERVVAHSVCVGAGKPLGVALARGFVGRIHREDHGGKKRRLRAREVVGAIGVEDRTIVLDLVEEVLDHAARQVAFVVLQQAANDEVAVPAIHLVEAAAGNDVAVGHIEQAAHRELFGHDIAQLLDGLGQMRDLDIAFLLQLLHRGRGGHSEGQIQHGLGACAELGIRDGRALVHRAAEGRPGMLDVNQNVLRGRERRVRRRSPGTRLHLRDDRRCRAQARTERKLPGGTAKKPMSDREST